MTDPLSMLLDPGVRSFITANAEADVTALALKGSPDPAWPFPLVLDQIAARRKAARKMPSWIANDAVLFPPASLIEQASSEATARYKASLVTGATFADLTAGAGVDCLALLERFASGIAVERDPDGAARLRHNLPLLARSPCSVWCRTAEDCLHDLPPSDVIMLDPQRRDAGKRGLFRLQDCSPDVLTLLPLLLAKAPTILLKTSPVLDIDQAIRQLGQVASVHIVEWQGECREVLYLIRSGPALPPDAIPLTAARIADDGRALQAMTFNRSDERDAAVTFGPPGRYLYEPSPAFLKAGAFRTLAARYHLAKLHVHTHLYTADEIHADFPGRVFAVRGLYQAGGKDLPLKRASITVRNFPLTPEALRKKLKLADGGDDTLFACTLHDDRKVLLHAVRVQV